MTEAEWLASCDPMPMLEYVQGRGTERKARLLRVGAARSVWPELTDERYRAAVEVAERYADGQADVDELRSHATSLYGIFGPYGMSASPVSTSFQPHCLVQSCVNNATIVMSPNGGANWPVAVRYTRGSLPSFLRDIFGNPFRPVTGDPRWFTSTVRDLAAAIYADRAFDRLPILADALEDAGCDNADILTHCRGDGPHVRGCWVVDLILGKE